MEEVKTAAFTYVQFSLLLQSKDVVQVVTGSLQFLG